MALLAFGVACFVLSIAGCGLVGRMARRLRLVDVPNERSLHRIPVPRVGGVAIVVSVWLVLGAGSRVAPSMVLGHADTMAWLAGASAIAVLGFVDDIRPLPAIVRLTVQLLAAIGVLAYVVVAPELSVAAGTSLHLPRALVLTAGVIFVVGTTNIYNFMDGMDGLAATQTITAGLALAAAAAASGQVDVALIAALVAAGGAGFLVHNAPPATLFLGDAGSTFIGFTFGTLAVVACVRPAPVPLGVVPVALAPFLLDGTFTLIRRLRRGERIWQAHKSHLYQRAVATGLTHRDVLIPYAAWSIASAAGAVLLARSGAAVTVAVAIAALVPLVLMWRWVLRLEAAPRRDQ